jgi:hypothetical protein
LPSALRSVRLTHDFRRAVLYILNPTEQAQLFSVETTAPFSRRNLRIAHVVDAT